MSNTKITPAERRKIGLNVWEHRVKTAQAATTGLQDLTRSATWAQMVERVGVDQLAADVDQLQAQLDAIRSALGLK